VGQTVGGGRQGGQVLICDDLHGGDPFDFRRFGVQLV
jgi:hypothetical protein